MNAPTRMDTAEMLGRIGRHWGWLLFFGIITLVAGVLTLFWPGETLIVVAIIFGVQLIFAGVFELIAALSPAYADTGGRWFSAILGALSIVVGVLCLRNVFATLLGLALLLGAFWIVYGIMRVFQAVADRERPSRGWAIVTGALSVLAGIVVLVWPGLSLLYLAIVLGVWLVIYGAIMIWGSIRLRATAHRGARAVPGSPSPT